MIKGYIRNEDHDPQTSLNVIIITIGLDFISSN